MFPRPISENGYFGMETYTDPSVIYSNDPTHPNAAFPFMSYASPGWSDPYYYCILLEAYDVPCNPAAIGVPKRIIHTVDCDPEPAGEGWGLDLCLIDQLPPPSDPELPPPPGGDHDGGPIPFDPDGPDAPEQVVMIAGHLDRAGDIGGIDIVRVTDDVSQRLKTAYAAVVERVVNEGVMDDYVVFRDAEGTVLMTAPVEFGGSGHSNGAVAGPSVGFLHAMPLPDGTATIELAAEGETIGSRSVSATAPTVGTVTAENVGDATAIRWEAGDDDGDALSADVFWSNDGESWFPAALDLDGDDVRIPHTTPLAGGDAVRVRVEVTDGSRTATGVSEPFSAPTHTASMVVGGVDDGAEVVHLDPLTLHALVADPDAREFAGAIGWRSDVDGELGTGAILATRDLSLGRHTVTASIEDEGVVVEASVTFIVVERTTPTRYGEAVDEFAAAFLLGEEMGDETAAAPLDSDGGADDAPWVPLAAGGVVAFLGAGLVMRRRV